MINALRAEIRRLLSRRITLISVLGLLALIGLFQLQVNSLVSPPSAAEVAQLQAEYEEYLQDWEANHQEWEAECVDSGGSAEDCAQPRPELSDWELDPIPFQDAVEPAIGFAIYLGGMLLFVAMASFIGAETTTGSLANWLTFVPNRTTVLVSKLVVVAGFSVVVGAVAGLLTVASSIAVTAAHSQPLTGLDAVWAMAARGIVVVLIFGVAGFAVGMLTGSTGASIGVLLGGVFATYTLTVLAFVSRWAGYVAPFNPGVNLQAILDGGTTYVVSAGPGAPTSDEGVERTLSLAQGLGYWAVVLAALVVISWALFRRRDLT